MELREIHEGRSQVCERILRSLPEWFGIEEAICQYVEDVERMPFLAAYSDGEACGFLALNLHNPWTAEIHVMAVLPAFHRMGVGFRPLEEFKTLWGEANPCLFLVKSLK
jgi:GNAT superfamily N-acetyltransferase